MQILKIRSGTDVGLAFEVVTIANMRERIAKLVKANAVLVIAGIIGAIWLGVGYTCAEIF